ncbi:MAG TPA: class I SAM-dependent methyltransferase [Allosphingosinicella sp.]|nr:class I SAM-dependent methyltransferase [Allosphingosinicella sp.]
MSADRPTDAWAAYWSSAGADRRGCLPNAKAGLGPALRSIWQDFAARLPRNAKVLDLGTGDGAVLRELRAVRSGLALTGVDSAPQLPSAPAGIKLKPGVAMERLPFPEHAFDAVTSQFGIEYGDTALIAGEAARVLKPEGRLCFIIHNREGLVVTHNLARRDALLWASRDSGYLEQARRLAAARLAMPMPMPTPQRFRDAVAEAGRLFPTQSAAAEFVAAILQVLDQGRLARARHTIELLATLEERASNEIERINALEKAACGGGEIAAIAKQLRQAGIIVREPAPLVEAEGRPSFAWLLSGSKEKK